MPTGLKVAADAEPGNSITLAPVAVAWTKVPGAPFARASAAVDSDDGLLVVV